LNKSKVGLFPGFHDMVTDADLIQLPFTPDLTMAGIYTACRGIVKQYPGAGVPLLKVFQRMVVHNAMELAFRRYLGSIKVSYNSVARKTFAGPDVVDMVLNGWRVDLIPFFLENSEQVQKIQTAPSCLLEAEVILPSDDVVGELPGEKRIYVFVYVTGRLTHDWNDIRKAQSAGQPVFLMHFLPLNWFHSHGSHSLGRLNIRSEGDRDLQLQLIGEANDGQVIIETLSLTKGMQVMTECVYRTLTLLHLEHEANGRIELSSSRRGMGYQVSPAEWVNGWVYGMSIYLCGYISHGDFARRSRRWAPGKQGIRPSKISGKKRSLQVNELCPLAELLG
jgi:hypothetical protein